jgi:hypothetical protein
VFTQVLILIIVGALAAAAVYGLHRLISQITNVARQRPEPVPAPPAEPTTPVSADGLVYLFAHRFVREPAEQRQTQPRRQVFAPQTGEEVDARDLGEQLMFASLVALHETDHISFRVEECEASFFPPFPHKRWTMQVCRDQALPPSPIADVLGRGLDLIEQRLDKQGQSRPHFVGLDEVIEQAIRVARQELTFWQKAGVYADLRSYVESALIAQGYLTMPARDTWLERMRHARPRTNEEATRELEGCADELAESLEAFRREHGRPPPEGELPDGHPRTLADVDPALISEEFAPDEMPLYDCLRVSVHEALASLRQVEPSEDI